MKPITGRTHQLRAHAEAIGHPIIGDPKYPGNAERSAPHDPLRAVPDDVEHKLHLLARRLVAAASARRHARCHGAAAAAYAKEL